MWRAKRNCCPTSGTVILQMTLKVTLGEADL
jgi:hypothetical protein